MSIGIFLLAIASNIIYFNKLQHKAFIYAIIVSICTFLYYLFTVFSIKFHKIINIGFILFPFCFGFIFGLNSAILFFIAEILGIFYTENIISKKYYFRKNVYLKPISISLVWAILSFLLPVYIIENQLSVKLLLFSFNRFIFIFILCVLCDYVDNNEDKDAGILTFSMKYEKILDNITSFLLLFLIAFQFFLDLKFEFLFVNVALYSVLLIYILLNKKRDRLLFDLIILLLGGAQVLIYY